VVKTMKADRFGEFRAAGAPEGIEIHVSDNGPGIPADQQVNIFVPFFTTKQKGTGLGLALAKKVADAHGGLLTLEDADGGGTVARLSVPG
jgi:signal transduction histidine kinase